MLAADRAALLRLLDTRALYERVVLPHLVARETFIPQPLITSSQEEFFRLIGSFVAHDSAGTGGSILPGPYAVGIATNLLRSFPLSGYPDGIAAAVASGMTLSRGGMPVVLNYLADAMARAAFQEDIGTLVRGHVNVLATEERHDLSAVLQGRVGAWARTIGDATFLVDLAPDPERLVLHVRELVEAVLTQTGTVPLDALAVATWGRP